MIGLRQSDGWDDTTLRQSLDLSRRVDWFIFACSVDGRTIIAYARSAVCPIRCDRFTVQTIAARRPM